MRGPHGLPPGRRGDGADQPDWLHAQPAAHGGGELPGEGSRHHLAANNGGWQWASSSGCDAQPYFRIFNPVSQSEKFDPAGKFIRRYLPQLAALPDAALHAPWTARPVDLAAAGLAMGRDYPQPLVPHDEARLKTLERYAVVKAERAGPSR